MSFKLAGAKLNIWKVWDIPWDDRIDESDGETARLIRVAKSMANDLRSAAGLDAISLVDAWLLLWERILSVLTSALTMVAEQLLIAGGGLHWSEGVILGQTNDRVHYVPVIQSEMAYFRLGS